MAIVRDQLWLDSPDALHRIDTSNVSEAFKKVARDLVNDGLAVVRGWHDPATCVEVISDYKKWCGERPDVVAANLDVIGHEKRLCNFHHASPAALAVGQNPQVMKLLDFLFGYDAGIYTSLTFKYSTQQPVHRDTPHFATWPTNYFFGVWVALQDIDPDSGPLFYFKNSHHFPADPQSFMRMAEERLPQASEIELARLALDLYNGYIIEQSRELGEPMIPELKAGDMVIWHPQTPHGGSPARNPELERWSIVFHCAPVDIQVFQHDRFFTYTMEQQPPPRYGFVEKEGRKVAWAGETAFM